MTARTLFGASNRVRVTLFGANNRVRVTLFGANNRVRVQPRPHNQPSDSITHLFSLDRTTNLLTPSHTHTLTHSLTRSLAANSIYTAIVRDPKKRDGQDISKLQAGWCNALALSWVSSSSKKVAACHQNTSQYKRR